MVLAVPDIPKTLQVSELPGTILGLLLEIIIFVTEMLVLA
jgi:hypothetical protein